MTDQTTQTVSAAGDSGPETFGQRLRTSTDRFGGTT